MLKNNFKIMRVKIKKGIGTFKAGEEVSIFVNANGVPVNFGNQDGAFWRRRFKDAKIDGCIEFISDSLAYETKEVKKNKKGAK